MLCLSMLLSLKTKSDKNKRLAKNSLRCMTRVWLLVTID